MTYFFLKKMLQDEILVNKCCQFISHTYKSHIVAVFPSHALLLVQELKDMTSKAALTENKEASYEEASYEEAYEEAHEEPEPYKEPYEEPYDEPYEEPDEEAD